VLSLASGYARLDIPKDEDFSAISESIRALLHVCRLNGFRGALVVSRQDAFDWRSSVRIALRFAAARGAVDGMRLGLVADHFNDAASHDVLAVARSVGVECRVFRREGEAIAWLSSGSARPAPEVPPRSSPRR
jgi:hypothetical protein